MYDTTPLSVPTNAEKLFNFLLFFYPKQYRRKYGKEMRLLFQDMYQEEVTKKGSVSLTFWFSQVGDITKSLIEQHIDIIQKQGIKKYLQQTFHINKYNVISGIFLLPVFFMTLVELISRIAQGDLTHYNRPVYAFFSHTFLYWTPILFTWVILFPLLAALISFIPLVKAISKKKVSVFSIAFLHRNIITIGILFIGFGFIALIKLHDFMPCMFYGLTHFGFGQFGHIVSVCRRA
jgi:hypothetical protein